MHQVWLFHAKLNIEVSASQVYRIIPYILQSVSDIVVRVKYVQSKSNI